jgi:hypothetical protein
VTDNIIWLSGMMALATLAAYLKSGILSPKDVMV